MPNVFISSTKGDLTAYREAARDICLDLKLTPLMMEYFEAEGRDGKEGSKRQLDQADVYVGIFAHKYGAVTEVEYDHAVEKGLEILCYIVDPDQDWPVENTDFDDKLQKLIAFKEKVEKAHIRKKFTSVEDFKVKLIQALASWQQRHQSQSIQVEGKEIDKSLFSTKPQRPRLLMGREKDVENLHKRLGIPEEATSHSLTVVRGWPGVGKTTLMSALVYDARVEEKFKDNIFWAVLGENGNPSSALISWGRQLGIPDIATIGQLDEMIRRVRAALAHRKSDVLLIIDDAWEANHAIPLMQVAADNCKLLITTRFPAVAGEVVTNQEDIYRLKELDQEPAFELLSQLAPDVSKIYPDQSRILVTDLEGLPLAIRVAGRLLAEEHATGLPVLPLMQEIRESHVLLDHKAPDDRFDPMTGTTPTIDFLIARSVTNLDEESRDCFAMLGAFAPKPATFDLGAMQFIWEKDDPKPYVKILVGRGLLEPIPEISRYQMHAVLVMYAQSLLEDEEEENG